MKTLSISLAAVLALSGTAFSQWSDDFNRPDGPIGGSWTPVLGTWDIQTNQGAHTSTGVNDVLQHTLATGAYSSTTVQLDVIGNAGTGNYYSGVVIGLGGTDAILVKIQDQVTTATFSNIGIYHRVGTGWGNWTGGVGTTFGALTAPFASGRMKVFFPNPDTIQVEIDTDFNGVADQIYTRTGVGVIAASLGFGHGIACWNSTALFDNWDLTNVPQPPSNDACASASPLPLGTAIGTTVLGTNDGSSSCDTTGNDVWYSFTASSFGGQLTLNTCGSAIDTVLSVYDACGGNLIACDDNSAACGGNAASLTLSLTPNQSLRVRVSDKGTAGAFSLTSLYQAIPPCGGTTLQSLYSGGNGGSLGGQVFFDLNVTRPSGITISQIDVSAGEAIGTLFNLSVYAIPTTYVGSEANLAAWTLVSTGSGILNGLNTPSIADVTPFTLPFGSHGIALVLGSNAGFDYTNGNGGNQVYTNADVTMTLGAALNVPWTGTAFTPRVFNGAIRYDCGAPPPSNYCTAGTTTNGCTATISASGTPSASASSGFTLTASNVEGQKQGLLFYSISGQQAVQWGTGSSFLCVKSPTQRLPSQSSGGTVSSCDGVLSNDWLAFIAANPTSVGTPLAGGQVFQAQAWFRDPPASKSTSLSNAIEFTLQP